MISHSRSIESRPRISRSIRMPIGALAIALVALPIAAQRPAPAQRGGTPRADTPQLVVAVLTSRDPRAGVAAADAIRRRIQDEHAATDLYVVPRAKIDQTLAQSGYNPDSALGTNDLMELARQVRGDYALAGTVERTPSGVRTSVRLLTQTAGGIVAESLTPIDGADLGDVAKQVDRAVSEALRALAFYHECTSAARGGDYKKAMTAAQQGLRLRPASALLNLCVLSILNVTKAGPDSVILVASAVAAGDSESPVAWASLANAYDQRGDSARAIDATRILHRLDPTNADVTLNLVDRFVAAGRSDSARALLGTALADAPTKPGLLRKRWLLDLRLGEYAHALVSGAALIAADSGAATADYYDRQLGAATRINDTASARRLAVEASARFPKNADFLIVRARHALDNGATAEALGLIDRALAIAPANAAAWQLAIAARGTSEVPDSAVATARHARVAGVQSDAVGVPLAAVVAQTVAKAQSSQKRTDWDTAFGVAQSVDSLAPSPRNSFYLGVAGFQVAADEIQSLSTFASRRTPTRAERQAACASATHVQDLFEVVTLALRTGGRFDPQNAGKIMTAMPSYSEFVSSVKRASCR